MYNLHHLQCHILVGKKKHDVRTRSIRLPVKKKKQDHNVRIPCRFCLHRANYQCSEMTRKAPEKRSRGGGYVVLEEYVCMYLYRQCLEIDDSEVSPTTDVPRECVIN